uniref:Uncharacterized protein n=1 Tax=Physcomitrium patens TaxID=3218 RepID=A0A2K1L6I5_PHYPA|nr:hypothetical protein PHYPA_000047 [Physcomitrium patens]
MIVFDIAILFIYIQTYIISFLFLGNVFLNLKGYKFAKEESREHRSNVSVLWTCGLYIKLEL